MDRVDAVVIGGGVVGLAAARALAMQGRETIILERHGLIGSEASSRNSEVIHAGIYYPQGSLKARLCVRGREMLYAHCASHKVEHRRIGKLIVATDPAQLPDLARLRAAAIANGVDDLKAIDAGEARALEPEISCVAALLSPSTGIIDSHAYMLSLLGDAEERGAMIAFNADVTRMTASAQGIAITLAGDEEPSLLAGVVVNAAGLHAPALAAAIDGLALDFVPRAYFAKGCYFGLVGKAPFSRLIYPVPEPGGLGTHLTLDLGGQARFGPDVEWVDTLDYAVDQARGDKFYASIRNYWPGLADGQLVPGYSGIRAKLAGPGQEASDFRIDGPAQHGVPGLINLFGIESPGLTSSLAIAEIVSRLAEGDDHA
jgi:L-2-hydroxyglutarate oxidase LhgO